MSFPLSSRPYGLTIVAAILGMLAYFRTRLSTDSFPSDLGKRSSSAIFLASISTFAHSSISWFHQLLSSLSPLLSSAAPSPSPSMTVVTTAQRPRRSSVAGDLLAKLPSTVVVRIFEATAEISKRDICSVSRLNRRYHILADAVLYKTVRFFSPELHLIFGQSLSRRPRRGSAIHEIKLAYPASQLSEVVSKLPVTGARDSYDKPLPFDSLSRTISTMSNLVTLDIAVPEALLHGIGQLFNGPFDLACLQTCTLFYQCQNDQFWDLQENIHVFGHPTLETLVIKKARLGDKPFDLPERPEETGLKRLHLIDCDISDDGLFDLMHYPAALTEFVMTQSPDPGPDLEETSDSMRDYIIAIQPQCNSLETITVDHPLLRNRRALSLRDFVKLKTLRLNWDHQLFGHSSKKPRLNSVGMPPELETLEFFNQLGTDEEVTDLFVAMLKNLTVMARKLTHLIVMESEEDEKPVPKEVEEACKSQPQLRVDIIGRMDTVDCGEDTAEGNGSDSA
ncbi:F-box domain-containing [Cordyceps militaris]|uniref:F-box domain-containing n=1 Tax=Cordyceps militaris TaxID=73501 RepID=A0A2H4SBW7_CORMI|nr:F-box domain-containing [Cordyceps militaris]